MVRKVRVGGAWVIVGVAVREGSCEDVEGVDVDAEDPNLRHCRFEPGKYRNRLMMLKRNKETGNIRLWPFPPHAEQVITLFDLTTGSAGSVEVVAEVDGVGRTGAGVRGKCSWSITTISGPYFSA